MATPMDQSPPPTHPAAGVLSSSAAHIAYNAPPHQQQAAMPVPPPSSFPSSSTQLTFQQAHQFHLQQQQHQQQQLQAFWADRILEIEQTTDFKNHSLPLARIKKIMKADEEVRMISAETPIVFAKACETFILELTLRSWMNTEENKRRTLQKNDIAAAITRTDIFDFLVDIVPRDELKEEGLGFPMPGPAALPMVGVPSDSLPYYHVPPPTTFMGKSMERAADIYLPHLGAYMWQMQQGQPHQQHQAQQQQQTMPE